MNYNKFIQTKKNKVLSVSKINTDDIKLNKYLFDWQKLIVKWCLKMGKSALFAECGLGKTIMQLDWANQVSIQTKKPVLILAPLAVSIQSQEEGVKFGMKVNVCLDNSDVKKGINITNYEKLHKFDTSKFSGVVIDESGILKDFTGKYRNEIIEQFKNTPYKLAATATPAPNDFTEIGNHSEFLDIMTRQEMLSMYFINDTSNTGTWRLKKHVKNNVFWEWLSSWACMLTKPSDLGFDDDGFILPEIKYHEVIVPCKQELKYGFFHEQAKGVPDRLKIRRETIKERTEKASELINGSEDNWVIWCGLNAESENLKRLIDNSVEITGSQKQEVKEKTIFDFAKGKIQKLITKPKIAGRGINWQISNKMVFVGLNDSFEDFYQCVRRIWRFGQTKKVDVYIIIEEREGTVLANLKKKDKNATIMIENMVTNSKKYVQENIESAKDRELYLPHLEMEIPAWL